MQPPAAQSLFVRWRSAWLLCGWGALVLAGLAWMGERDHAAGERGRIPTEWPAQSRLLRDREHPTLLVFAHPHCPCTVATLAELEQIVARSGERLRVEVVFCVPEGAPADWERTDLWRQAAAIPGVALLADHAAFETRLFGARTSGTALFYDAAGALAFQGGITGSRGHAGENEGERAVLACLEARPAQAFEVPVFGCPLLDPQSTDAQVPAEVDSKP